MTLGELLEVLSHGTFVWLTDADTNDMYDADDDYSDKIDKKYWDWKVHEVDPHVDGNHEPFIEVFIVNPSRSE